jgi:ABC-type multidrug transport system ATPase subunit
VAIVRDAEDWAALAEREVWERVSRVEAEGATALASAHGEAEDLARRIALLKGELAKARQTRDTIEENYRGLSDAAANTDRWFEEFKRECQE